MWRRAWLAAGIALVAVFSLWLRAAVPVHAIGLSPHDDLLFVRLAYHLGAGTWLGPYDQLTLAKGMAYPAFILSAFAAAVPLKIAEQLAYLGAAGLASWLLLRLTRSGGWALVLFAALALNPILWTPSLARVIREGLYVSLSLALVMLAALALREGASARGRFVLAVAAGLMAGAFWLTREEGHWILLPLSVLLIAALYRAWRFSGAGASRLRAARGVAAAVGLAVVAAAAFAGLVSSVASINYQRYGAFITNEMVSVPFQAAYGALGRIPSEDARRYIYFPKEAREKAYAVSAAARELQPTFEGRIGEAWRSMACGIAQIETCPGVPEGWFMWALRDAAAAAGHHTSAGAALAFYDRLASEINAACDSGRLACLPPRNTLRPPLRFTDLRDAAGFVPKAIAIMWNSGNGSIGPQASDGPEALLDLFGDLVGPLARESRPFVVIRGQMQAPDAADLFVRDRTAASFRAELRLPASPSAALPAGERRAIDFDLSTDCLRPSCEFVVRWRAEERSFPVAQLGTGLLMAVPDLELSLTSVLFRGERPGLPVASEMRRGLQLAIARRIAAIYAEAMPLVCMVALFGLLVAVALRRAVPPRPGLLALALASAVAVGARVALLSYIEAASFPALNALYLSPATPFLIMFGVLGCILGIEAAFGLYRVRRPVAAHGSF